MSLYRRATVCCALVARVKLRTVPPSRSNSSPIGGGNSPGSCTSDRSCVPGCNPVDSFCPMVSINHSCSKCPCNSPALPRFFSCSNLVAQSGPHRRYPGIRHQKQRVCLRSAYRFSIFTRYSSNWRSRWNAVEVHSTLSLSIEDKSRRPDPGRLYPKNEPYSDHFREATER